MPASRRNRHTDRPSSGLLGLRGSSSFVVLADLETASAPVPIQESQREGGKNGRGRGIPDEDFYPEDQDGHRSDADEHEARAPAHCALLYSSADGRSPG